MGQVSGPGSDGLIVDERQLQALLNSLPDPEPGSDCYVCHRRVPHEKKDDNIGRRRQTMSLSIPDGEEGNLESMLIALVDRFRDQWPAEYAAMRDGVGLQVVGGRSWKYRAIHFAVYAVLNVSGLEPAEEGA